MNYGTQAGLFARELRNQGIEAISVTYPDAFKRMTDVELKHGGNVFQKVFKHIWNYLFRIKCMFKYDIFHFYYGTTLLPYQLDLPLLKWMRKKIVIEYLGNDIQLYKKSVEKYKWTNMPGFLGSGDPIAYDKKIEKRYRNEKKYTDLQIVCAPCYSEFAPGSIVIPLAIDLDAYSYYDHPKNDIPIVLHAPTNRGFKGTDFIVEAVNRIINEGFRIKFKIVENVTHFQLKQEYINCDIFIDQIMGGWYGTAAIEAMALGRPVICSIRKSYFEYIDYGEKIPIIHADPDNIYDVIKQVIINKQKLPEFGRASRAFITEVHDSKKITKKLESIYSNLIN